MAINKETIHFFGTSILFIIMGSVGIIIATSVVMKAVSLVWLLIGVQAIRWGIKIKNDDLKF